MLVFEHGGKAKEILARRPPVPKVSQPQEMYESEVSTVLSVE